MKVENNRFNPEPFREFVPQALKQERNKSLERFLVVCGIVVAGILVYEMIRSRNEELADDEILV